MATTRVSPKHQITIPKPVFDAVHLEPGDILDAIVENGKIVLTPKRLADKTPAAKFTAAEQRTLECAKHKIQKINHDLQNSRGLTVNEIKVAAKADLIDLDQGYFWTERWQRNHRASMREIAKGNLSPVFDNAKDAIAHLHKEAEKYIK